MNYDILIPKILENEVNRNPKGYFSRLRLTHRRILKWIFDHTPNIDANATIGERTYWIIHHIMAYPLCEECNSKSKKFYNIIRGYGCFCSLQCAGKNEKRIRKSVQTSIAHFGKDNFNNRNKARQTCKALYGEEFYVNTQDFKDKLQKFLDDNNVSNVSQIPEVMQKSIRTKRRRYGDAFECIVKKQKETISHYSDEKRQQIQHRRKSTCKRLYGVEYSSQSDSVKEKTRQTFRKNYGVDYPMLSADFRHNVLGRKYAYDGKSFDSSDELALYIWLNDHMLKFEYQPAIGFEYVFNGQKRMYFPDFRVGDKCFEVKGSHFFKEDGTMQNPFDHSQDALYEAKHQCMLKNHVTTILTNSQFMKRIRCYVETKYGKSFLKQFKTKTKDVQSQYDR